MSANNPALTIKRITSRTWMVMAALAVTGQIAWAVENSWFNTFVYDEITPDPRPVAWMVAASAITATLTTLIIGTLSDRTRSRLGRRKPFILFGYILWGISTIIFPLTAYIKVSSLAVLAVILADSVMTFFGSTANDAAFNAWTTDVASSNTRGRVEGLLQVCTFVAQVVVTVLAGMVIDNVGYFIFFYILGGVVVLVGLVSGSLLQEPPSVDNPRASIPFWQEFTSLFSMDTVRQNPRLFLLMLSILISNIGTQVSFPYLIVYLTNFIGMSKTQYSIIGGAVMVGGALVAVPFGILADRQDRRLMMILATTASCLGVFAFAFMRSLVGLAIFGFIWQGFLVAVGIASMAWMKDLLPEENRGKFLGVRMIFWIALPMVIGPFIGSSLIQAYGIPTVTNGQAGFIPVPIIFIVDSIVGLFSLLPLLFVHGKVLPLKSED